MKTAFLGGIFLTLLFACISIALPAQVNFIAEEINFCLSKNHFSVEGYYHFRNNSTTAVSRLLFYPFPLDSCYGEVTDIKAVMIEGDSTSILLDHHTNGLSFTISILPGETAVYLLAYVQELRCNRAEYILTTTRSWKKPLENVDYRLTVSQDIIVDSLSILPDSISVSETERQFYWHRKNFFPDRNFIVFFNR
ncbi:MAG: DUF4424 family protein [Candidatus Cloacimonetes bacterium]|nr:DUF4424 family protein [Candidatus Cloacimonadota bacterium]